MKTYIAQRLGIAVLTLFGMSVVIFVLLRLAPGDIVDVLFSAAGYVNPEEKQAILRELGLDKPVTETVFNLPGVARFLVEAILWRDYPVVQNLVMFIAILVILSNLAVDLLYGVLDPRVRYAS